MAPKKKLKSGASSSSTPAPNVRRFWDAKAEEHYQTLLFKPIAQERGLDVSLGFSPGPIANVVGQRVAKHINYTVLVRGKMVPFDAQSINTINEIPLVEHDEYLEYKSGVIDYDDILHEL